MSSRRACRSSGDRLNFFMVAKLRAARKSAGRFVKGFGPRVR